MNAQDVLAIDQGTPGTEARVRPAELAGVGITNQRETVVAWERSTGQPLHRAIV